MCKLRNFFKRRFERLKEFELVTDIESDSLICFSNSSRQKSTGLTRLVLWIEVKVVKPTPEISSA